ncbi:hypothetical protein WAG28_28225 [Bacillus cereus]|uniref:hypothetical protein n=1 Tax=Bacillus cereus TaxID=1396 RepID=UPI003012DCD0
MKFREKDNNFMCKTRFTINVNLFDVITFVFVLFGLAFVMTVYATKIIAGYQYSDSLCIISFIYIITYLVSIYIPMYILLKPRKTKHTDKKTV